MGTLISGSTGIDKIQNNAVDIADLSATGTPGTNFLRGDNTWADALPTQSGNAGKFLTTNASTASWAEAGGGLTQSSTWYVTTSYQASAGYETITNWAESNAANYDRLGTSPTQSSGIFTLPATGWWMISLHLVCTQSTGVNDSWGFVIKTSTDSGSNYDWAVASCDRFISGINNSYKQRTATAIVKCEDESTFRFGGWLDGVKETAFNVRGGSQAGGNGSTYMNIMKLADV